MSAATPTFTITAGPKTDIWRKPPTTDVSNAPLNTHSSLPLSSFIRARVSFSSDYTHRYDQGGLFLSLTHPDKKQKWLKTGIEFYNNRTFLSTVGTDSWADWSIYPVDATDSKPVTIEIKREGDENGKGLWVYQLILDENGNIIERTPLREICWFFADEQGWDITVSAFAARPADEDVVGKGSGLDVKFWGLEVGKV